MVSLQYINLLICACIVYIHVHIHVYIWYVGMWVTSVVEMLRKNTLNDFSCFQIQETRVDAPQLQLLLPCLLQRERQIQRNEWLSQAWGLCLALGMMWMPSMILYSKEKVVWTILIGLMLRPIPPHSQDKSRTSHPKDTLMGRMIEDSMIAWDIAWSVENGLLKMPI